MPQVLTMTLYPVLTRMARKSEAFQRANGLVLRLVGWMAFPARCCFRWWPSQWCDWCTDRNGTPRFRLLPYALAGGTAGALYQATTTLMLADVQHRGCAVAEFLTLASLLVCLMEVLPHGIAWYLAAVAMVQSAVLLWMLWSLRKTGALSTRAIVVAVGAPLGVGAAARAACVQLPPVWAGLLFAAIYAAGLWLLCPAELRELFGYLPWRRKR